MTYSRRHIANISPAVQLISPVDGIPIVLAFVSCLFAAARVLDPGIRGDVGFIREIGSLLVLGMVFMGSANGIAASANLMRIRRVKLRVIATVMMRPLVRTARQLGLSVTLTVPAFATGWELGASGSEFYQTASGLVATTIAGPCLGILVGVLGCGRPASILITSTMTAGLLWPVSLGWIRGLARMYPEPELPLSVLLLMSAAGLLACCGICIFRVNSKGRR